MYTSHIQFLTELLFPLESTSLHIPEMIIIERINPSLLKFRKYIKNLTNIPIFIILDSLSQILGYGEGSTPMSDDIFLGMIATIYSLESDISKEFELLSKIPFERFTTSESSQLCRDFFFLKFPIEVECYLDLLKTALSDPLKISLFKREIKKIHNLGASSGKSFLLGSLWELKFRKAEDSSNR
ncbi:MAG: DUF2877 domain-containing protein [Candidatus Hodarchaeota archaeon]